MSAFRTKVKPPSAVSVTYSVISQGVFVAKLGWTPAQSAWPNSYYVVYKDDVELATGITTNAYRDTSVQEGESHDYVVSTVNVNEVESNDGRTASVRIPSYPVWETGWSLSILQNVTDSVAARCTDPDGGALTFSRQGGTAPAGVTVSSAGVVTVGSSTAGAYTLILRASNGTLTSDYTANLTITSVAQTPDPPANRVATAISSSEVKLDWTRGPGGPDPDDYDIRYSTTQGGATTVVAHAGAAVTRSVTGLSPGDYYFEIRAGLGANESAWVQFSPFPLTLTSTPDVANFIIPATATVFDGASAAPIGGGANRRVVSGDIVEFAPRSAGTGGSSTALIIRNLELSADKTVRITVRAPTSGQAIIKRQNPGSSGHVFRLENCNGVDFRFRSTSTSVPLSPDGKRHGVKVSATATGDDNPAQWVRLSAITPSATYKGCRNITIDGLEVDGGYPRCTGGIGISANDHTAKAADYPGEWIENIVFEHLYIHDVAYEGIYAGANPYLSFVSNATEGTGRDLPIRYAKIRYCWLVDIAREGINPKSWYGGNGGGDGATDNSIHDNVLVRVCKAPTEGNGAINCNSCKVDIYNNWIEDPGNLGINYNVSAGTNIDFPDSDTVFKTRIYNNVLRKTAASPTSGDGLQVQHAAKNGQTVPASWYARVYAFNNTVVNFNGTEIDLTNAHPSSGAWNNLLPGGSVNFSSATSNSTNATGGTAASLFVNPNGSIITGSPDLHLKAANPASGTIGSPAGNPAAWTTSMNIAAFDFEGTARTQAGADVGAYEF